MDLSYDKLIQFKDCLLLKDHKLINSHLWIRNGKIIDPEPIFYDEKKVADVIFYCNNNIIAPGFIDVQINGAYGIDFSQLSFDTNQNEQIDFVGKNIIKHGVTSYVPTIITSPNEYYHKVIKYIKISDNNTHKSNVIGLHLEGPFINPDKKGIHDSRFIFDFMKNVAKTVDGKNVNSGANGFPNPIVTYQDFVDVYGPEFDSKNSAVKLITLAPEYPGMDIIIRTLTKDKNIKISLGHSMAHLEMGEDAVNSGASFITHLFNAMLPFHHRDPGLVGLLSIAQDNHPIYFGLITDGIHTNPAAIKIAQRTLPQGLVIITDAILTMGLNDIETEHEEVFDKNSFVGKRIERYRSIDETPARHFTFAGKDVLFSPNGKTAMSEQHTIAGGMTPFDECVQYFHKNTGCSIVEALECGSLHAAQMLGISNRKGTLDFGADADLVVLEPIKLEVRATFLAGHLAYEKYSTNPNRPVKPAYLNKKEFEGVEIYNIF